MRMGSIASVSLLRRFKFRGAGDNSFNPKIQNKTEEG